MATDATLRRFITVAVDNTPEALAGGMPPQLSCWVKASQAGFWVAGHPVTAERSVLVAGPRPSRLPHDA